MPLCCYKLTRSLKKHPALTYAVLMLHIWFLVARYVCLTDDSPSQGPKACKDLLLHLSSHPKIDCSIFVLSLFLYLNYQVYPARAKAAPEGSRKQSCFSKPLSGTNRFEVAWRDKALRNTSPGLRPGLCQDLIQHPSSHPQIDSLLFGSFNYLIYQVSPARAISWLLDM